MSTGTVVEIIGAVVDVEFPQGSVPKVYDALNVTAAGLVLEVQQQLGDGVVRCIAMGSTDGLARGGSVENTGAPISVPVGASTMGRLFDVLGNPLEIGIPHPRTGEPLGPVAAGSRRGLRPERGRRGTREGGARRGPKKDRALLPGLRRAASALARPLSGLRGVGEPGRGDLRAAGRAGSDGTRVACAGRWIGGTRHSGRGGEAATAGGDRRGREPADPLR